MTERPNPKPGVPAPNTIARIEYDMVSERVRVHTITWPAGRPAADGVVAIVQRQYLQIGEPDYAVVVFWPSVPRVVDRMHHTQDVRGWYFREDKAATAAADVYRQVFADSGSEFKPETESDFDPDMLGSVGEHLRETWPYLFDSADLPAEDVAREALRGVRLYLAERR